MGIFWTLAIVLSCYHNLQCATAQDLQGVTASVHNETHVEEVMIGLAQDMETDSNEIGDCRSMKTEITSMKNDMAAIKTQMESMMKALHALPLRMQSSMEDQVSFFTRSSDGKVYARLGRQATFTKAQVVTKSPKTHPAN